MWTLDTRIEITPIGAYVAALATESRRLMEMPIPGLNSEEPAVKKRATAAALASDRLIGHIQDELARYDALPTFGAETEEEDAPNTPTLADLCAMEPEPELLPAPTEEEWRRFYEEDAEARNFSDSRSELLA